MRLWMGRRAGAQTYIQERVGLDGGAHITAAIAYRQGTTHVQYTIQAIVRLALCHPLLLLQGRAALHVWLSRQGPLSSSEKQWWCRVGNSSGAAALTTSLETDRE